MYLPVVDVLVKLLLYKFLLKEADSSTYCTAPAICRENSTVVTNTKLPELSYNATVEKLKNFAVIQQ